MDIHALIGAHKTKKQAPFFSLQLHGAASPEGKIFHGTKSAVDTRTDNDVDFKEERGVQEKIPFF